jgi:hypothetical protein
LRELAKNEAGGPGVAPVTGQFSTFGRRHGLLKNFECGAEGLGKSPAIGAQFEMGLNLFIPGFASGERAAG